jgi:phage/plasmid-associated DNA primase
MTKFSESLDKIDIFKLFDTWIQKRLGTSLKKERPKILEQTIKNFLEQHPDRNSEKERQELTKVCNEELDRIYAIVDHSILEDRVLRSKY